MAGHPLSVFQGSDPELFQEFNNVKEMAFREGELSKKHKLLIAMAIDVAKNSESGIRSLAIQALENGATKRELLETLRIAYYICGVGSMYAAAPALKDIL